MKIQFDQIVNETDEAWFVQFDEKQVWIPKSTASVDEEEKIIKAPVWFVVKKGLEPYAID